MTARFLEIDDQSRGHHNSLTGDDACYFLYEYTSGKNFSFSETNRLISNLEEAAITGRHAAILVQDQGRSVLAGCLARASIPSGSARGRWSRSHRRKHAATLSMMTGSPKSAGRYRPLARLIFARSLFKQDHCQRITKATNAIGLKTCLQCIASTKRKRRRRRKASRSSTTCSQTGLIFAR